MLQAAKARASRLLASLNDEELERWLPWFEVIELPLGHVLYESGCALSHAYFPTTAIVSLLNVMENGASEEIAVAGREGLVGIPLFMGGETTPSRAVVKSAGQGFRLPAQVMRKEFDRAGSTMHLLLRYTQELIANMLGVRREGVTEAARKLRSSGLIRYARGHVTVLDRAGLESRICECYAVVKREYDRLLPVAV